VDYRSDKIRLHFVSDKEHILDIVSLPVDRKYRHTATSGLCTAERGHCARMRLYIGTKVKITYFTFTHAPAARR